MPGPAALILPAAGTALRGWLVKKLTKKTAKRVIGGIAGTIALDKVVSGGRGGGGGGGSPFKWPISPFDPKGGGILTGGGGARGGGRVAAGEMGACPSGYHLNKRPLSDGTGARTVCVRNRSINYANGRAAKRAGRRLRGTVKMLKKSFTFVSARPPKGKFIVRKK